MAKITIDREKCKGCFLCVAFCPKGLIKPSKKLNQKGFAFAVYEEKGDCAGCSFCALICPDCCIEVYK